MTTEALLSVPNETPPAHLSRPFKSHLTPLILNALIHTVNLVFGSLSLLNWPIVFLLLRGVWGCSKFEQPQTPRNNKKTIGSKWDRQVACK